MPPCGRRRPTHPGPWVPSALPGASEPDLRAFQGKGPTNLDMSCKDALQKILKPSNYGAIDVWMRNHGIKDKRGIVLLAEAAVGDNGVPTKQDQAYSASRQPVQLNPKGRHRVSEAVHVTADRLQVDLNKLRCQEDQRDKSLVRKRNFVKDFTATPSTESVSEFYRLGDVPISQEPSAKVLNEDAKRGLTRWQIRGPEQSREDAAQICKALRSLGGAVDAVPTYTDQMRIRNPGGHGATNCLFDYGLVKRAHKSGNYMRQLPMNKGLSRSMPTIPPAYMEAEDIRNVTRPGGYVVNLMDCEPLQCHKNKQRNITSKIVQGGACSWTTSYNAGVGLSKTDP